LTVLRLTRSSQIAVAQRFIASSTTMIIHTNVDITRVEDDHFSLLRQGSVRLALKFAQALPQTVTVVAYAEFENVIEIDRDRNVVFDFGV